MSDHGHEGQSPFIQHHFDDAKHQFDSGKLGIWAFLVQEILFFSALFVAYIMYRTNHPELYYYANHYLDTNMGAINTAVLIVSSLTAAWAVRAAQLNQQKLLVNLLAVTVLCAFGFLTIKYFEYSHKYHDGILFGKNFKPIKDHKGKVFTLEGHIESSAATSTINSGGTETQNIARAKFCAEIASKGKPSNTVLSALKEDMMEPTSCDVMAQFIMLEVKNKPDKLTGSYKGSYKELSAWAGKYLKGGQYTGYVGDPTAKPAPPNTNMFFSIYFAMTGLHGIHVIGGIVVFVWLTMRARRGDFNEGYFGPIDYAALYWHLVDLIWIFLFPMLYLIH